MKFLIQTLLAWAAKRVLKAQKPLIIGVTGSAAKTSTKEAIGFVLEHTVSEYDIKVASGNLNTEYGLPLAILRVKKPEGKLAWIPVVAKALIRGLFPVSIGKKQVMILEYGADQPGDIGRLVKIAKPNIGVVTLVGNAHTLQLGSIENVQKEKGELIRVLPENGLAILNGNDDLVKEMASWTKARSELVYAKGLDLSPEIAIAVAHEWFKIDSKRAREVLKKWQRPPGRLNILRGLKGIWLIDDTYNANPASMTLALNELRRLKERYKAKRSLAVLGDMLELGQEENKAHKGIALLAQKAADEVVLVGPRFRRTHEGKWFPGPLQALEEILNTIQKGDIILVKGSQSMRMEKVSEGLLEDKSQASELLVRQSSYWKNKPYVAP